MKWTQKTTSVEHVLRLISMLNPKCWGSWHHALKQSGLATLRDAHLGGAVSCVWFWQCSDMMELCKVCVSMRKCKAVLPITNSSAGHSQPSCSEWPNSKFVLPFRTGYKQGKKGIVLPYLFSLWYAWWWVLQVSWFSSMLPGPERREGPCLLWRSLPIESLIQWAKALDSYNSAQLNSYFSTS